MNTGSALARFTITLSQAVTEPVQVEWFTSDGTAKAGVDYAANKGTVVFAPGETAKTVDILVYGRAVGSEDRTFFVEMLPPTNAILGVSIGECIITVDTSGSTPVTAIIVPTGPVGPKGDPGEDGVSPDPAEIAIEVAPLIDVGSTVLTAEGTETLAHPDHTTVKAVARRAAYGAAAKIATVTLADGQNTITAGDLTGDSVDFMAIGFIPKILRSGTMFEPDWDTNSVGAIVIEDAIAGDVLYAVQYDFSSAKRRYAPAKDVEFLGTDAGASAVGGSVYVVETFAKALLAKNVKSRRLGTEYHSTKGYGAANYSKDGSTGAPSTGNEMKFYDADGIGWALSVGPFSVVPMTYFGVVPGVDTPSMATANANNIKRGGELAFDYGMRLTLPPAKTFINDVVFSKPVGVHGVFGGLGAQQTGTGAGKDGYSEWVHRGTGWGIYYEPWVRNNGSFAPDGIVLRDFGIRGNTSGGCLGCLKINDDSVITDETRAKREVIIDNVTIAGSWTGYGLKMSWTFINNIYALKIWDCAVAFIFNRANSTNIFGLEVEGCLHGGAIIESAGFHVYGLMAEYLNNSRTYYTMPADYPVDPAWSSGVNSYVGIGFRVRGGQVSFIGGYTEGIPVIWQSEINSDLFITRQRCQILTNTNHVIRCHGGRNLVFEDNRIEGTIAAATFYRTPTMPYVGKHKIKDNTYDFGSSRPTSNAALGFFGEFDIYRTDNSDAGMQTYIQGISESRTNVGGVGDTGGYPVSTYGDVLACRRANISATGTSYTCTIGTTVVNAGFVNINVPAGCTLTVDVADVTKWTETSRLSVCVVSSGTAASPIVVSFTNKFRLGDGNADISTATGKRVVFDFVLSGGIFWQVNTTKALG